MTTASLLGPVTPAGPTRRLPRIVAALSLVSGLAACASPIDSGRPGEQDGGSSDTGTPIGSDDGPIDPTGLDDADTGADSTGGDDEPATTTMSAESDGGSTGQPLSCDDADGVCTKVFPEGWQGPVAVMTWADGETPPTCAGDYDTPVGMTLSRDLVAPPAACTCECGEPTGGACDGEMSLINSIVFGPGPNNCLWGAGTEVAALNANSGTPLNVPGPLGVFPHITDPPMYSGGTCESTRSMNLATPHFEGHLGLCEAAPAAGACDDDKLCLPTPAAPADAAMCVWQDGDVPCPSGWGYNERTVGYQGIGPDTRDCNACLCGAGHGSCTEGSVFLGVTTDGGGAASDTVPPETCSEWNSLYTLVQAVWSGVDPTDDIECNPSGGAPTGSVAGVDPVTVCCYGLDQ